MRNCKKSEVGFLKLVETSYTVIFLRDRILSVFQPKKMDFFLVRIWLILLIFWKKFTNILYRKLEKKRKKTNPAHVGLVYKMGFFNDKREHTFCLIFSVREEGLFNGKVGPRWFRPRAHAHGPKYIKHQQKISGAFWGHVIKWNISSAKGWVFCF